jgi:hypothetical protein
MTRSAARASSRIIDQPDWARKCCISATPMGGPPPPPDRSVNSSTTTATATVCRVESTGAGRPDRRPS